MTKVLVVDDDLDMLDVLAEQLLAHGYEVGTASSTQEACELLDVGAYDVLLSDINMPVLNGLQLAKMLKEAKAPLVQIAMSGLDYSEESRAGFQSFLMKPFGSEELVKAVRSAQALN